MTDTNTSLTAAEIEQRATLKQFREAFRKLARERKLTSTDILTYNLIRGLPADRGFTAVTNQTKLDNGSDLWHGLKMAKQSLKWKAQPQYIRAHKDFIERFAPSLTPEALAMLAGAL